MRNRYIKFFLILVIFIYSVPFAIAGEQGHYSPMPISARDTIMPTKGLYLVSYDMYYSSDTFKDRDGNKFDSMSASGTLTKDITVLGHSVPVTITGNLTADLDINLDTFIQMIPVMWVPGFKILGADYAFFIAPVWGYTRVDVDAKASAAGTISVGGISKTVTANKTVNVHDENTGFGDLYVQPIWLDWRGKQYDVGISYGVYCPTGFYDKDNIANIGLGFLTQQVQVSAYYYPFENKATALFVRPTYEWHSKKIDKHVQPGQNITLEYGLSQYIHPRAEIAVMGYNEWQLSEDHGSEAANKEVLNRVSGIGAQVTCWAVENKCAITGKFNKEYWAEDRFEGMAWSINVLWIF